MPSQVSTVEACGCGATFSLSVYDSENGRKYLAAQAAAFRADHKHEVPAAEAVVQQQQDPSDIHALLKVTQ